MPFQRLFHYNQLVERYDGSSCWLVSIYVHVDQSSLTSSYSATVKKVLVPESGIIDILLDINAVPVLLESILEAHSAPEARIKKVYGSLQLRILVG